MEAPYLSRSFCRLFFGVVCLVRFTRGFGTRFFSPTASPQQLPQCDSPTKLHQQARSSRSLVDFGTDSTETTMLRDVDPWSIARKNLRNPKCCVVSVCSDNKNETENRNTTTSTCTEYEKTDDPLQAHLTLLQERLADRGPSDIDLRVKIDTTTFESAMKDCLSVCSSMVAAGGNLGGDNKDERTPENETSESGLVLPATALAKLAMGMASFADDCTSSGLTTCSTGGGVFLRIVCASNYRAHDPVFHTDKAPLRGYATLKGVGTEFVTHPCTPLEYLALRSFGTKLPRIGAGDSSESQDLRCAAEKEFIVMKGDYYYCNRSGCENGAFSTKNTPSSWWQRAFACVHRSPPGSNSSRGGRRVIVSFDLADGDDDREWHDVQIKRQWRAGMTQRKSKLVA